jgi:hypothetical protein
MKTNLEKIIIKFYLLSFITIFCINNLFAVETELYSINFENDAPNRVSRQINLTEGAINSAKVVNEFGSNVLQVEGENVKLNLQTVTLPISTRGHQNPTLITFNIKYENSDEILIYNKSDKNPFSFVSIKKGGIVYDNANLTSGSPQKIVGVLKENKWYNVYINYDTEWKGYYISFTSLDGEKLELRRRVKDPSNIFTLAFNISSNSGKVLLDNFKAITGFSVDLKNKPSDVSEPVLFNKVVELTPNKPDVDFKCGTLYQSVKLDVLPINANNTLFVPLNGVFDRFKVEVKWLAKTKQVDIKGDSTHIILTLGSADVFVNGKKVKLAQPFQLIKGNVMIPLKFVAESLGYRTEWNEIDQKFTITELGKRFVDKTTTIPYSTLPETILVGATPPAEPRTPLVLTYTFKKPNNTNDDFSWTRKTYTEGSDWKSIAFLKEIEAEMIKAGKSEVWIRFQSTCTPDTYNHTFFATKHRGTINTYNDGVILRANVKGKEDKWLRFFNYITRTDEPGIVSQYGIHYKVNNANEKPLLDFALVYEKTKLVTELRDAGTASSKFKPVLDISHIRDPNIIKGSDGYYYITGTPLLHGSIPYAVGINDGIELFRSKERTGPFESLGYVWTFDNAKWANTKYFSADQARNIWAPEIAEINGKWYLTYFPTKFPKNGLKGYSVFQIGIAVADKPEGPYTDITDKPIVASPDPHLFQDDDGSVYLTYGNGYIAKLKPTMDGLAEAPRFIYPQNAHSACNEGSTLFKCDGKYYFGGAFSNHYFTKDGKYIEQTYDCELTVADNIYGPYSERFVGLKNAGNNGFFKDSDGNWYATIWQPGKITGVVRVEKQNDNTWRPTESYDVVPDSIKY